MLIGLMLDLGFVKVSLELSKLSVYFAGIVKALSLCQEFEQNKIQTNSNIDFRVINSESKNMWIEFYDLIQTWRNIYGTENQDFASFVLLWLENNNHYTELMKMRNYVPSQFQEFLKVQNYGTVFQCHVVNMIRLII
jgi:hypothetical protein